LNLLRIQDFVCNEIMQVGRIPFWLMIVAGFGGLSQATGAPSKGEPKQVLANFEAQLVIAPFMSFSEVKTESRTAAYSGDSFSLRIGFDGGRYASLFYYALGSEANRKTVYGITQKKNDSEFGAMFRFDVFDFWGLLAGVGRIRSEISDSNREHESLKFIGTRFFVGTCARLNWSRHMFVTVEATTTLAGSYGELNGNELTSRPKLSGNQIYLGAGGTW
jgi:hypothetical protein